MRSSGNAYGVSWPDLPEEVGDQKTSSRQVRRWAGSGIFDVLLETVPGAKSLIAGAEDR
jgi:hypothetical protein